MNYNNDQYDKVQQGSTIVSQMLWKQHNAFWLKLKPTPPKETHVWTVGLTNKPRREFTKDNSSGVIDREVKIWMGMYSRSKSKVRNRDSFPLVMIYAACTFYFHNTHVEQLGTVISLPPL